MKDEADVHPNPQPISGQCQDLLLKMGARGRMFVWVGVGLILRYLADSYIARCCLVTVSSAAFSDSYSGGLRSAPSSCCHQADKEDYGRRHARLNLPGTVQGPQLLGIDFSAARSMFYVGQAVGDGIRNSWESMGQLIPISKKVWDIEEAGSLKFSVFSYFIPLANISQIHSYIPVYLKPQQGKPWGKYGKIAAIIWDTDVI